MRMRRANKLLVEPPALATGDIAFNLIVFFLVCASVQPDSGRKQTIPSSETAEEEQEQNENVEVMLTRTAVAINGNFVRQQDFPSQLKRLLANKPRPEDKIVVVKSKPDTPYAHWISVTALIEELGGIITLQLEEEREIQLPD